MEQLSFDFMVEIKTRYFGDLRCPGCGHKPCLHCDEQTWRHAEIKGRMCCACRNASDLKRWEHDIFYPPYVDLPRSKDECRWCGTDSIKAAKRHEGPHATWCPHYRRTYK